MENFNHKIIVLDDDPTGIQTVHDIYVYTDWEYATIRDAFTAPEQMFFILTNSRSFSAEHTREVHRTIARRIVRAARETGRDYIIISRGDSTLRGHFPLETETLRTVIEAETGNAFDGEILCPFFPEGGRYTIGNIHYVKEGDQLIPAGETEFAKDRTFGYRSSDLRDYVAEKTDGKWPSETCICITLEELRDRQIQVIYDKLMTAAGFQKIIVNAAEYADLEVFCEAWIKAVNSGRKYLIRSAAALPKVIGNISDIPLLTGPDLIKQDTRQGGLIIIGSHVAKTTGQLNALMESEAKLKFLEFSVDGYHQSRGLEPETERILILAEQAIRKGRTAVIYTSRTLLVPAGSSKEETLLTSVSISHALTDIVRRLNVTPRFLIAKGGITSSDVGTRGLAVKKALVMGQIRAGIPVWMTGSESKFPGMPYIIFPGNVGDSLTLREIAEELSK